MLTKLSTLILGIIAEKSRSPYDITKMIDELETKKWFPIADSTVYATIVSLEKKGLIKGKVEQGKKLPKKTFFSVTEEGKNRLKASVAAMLGDAELEPTKFDIGIILLKNLTKAEALERLKNKLAKVEVIYYQIKRQILLFDLNPKSSIIVRAMLKHRLHMLEADLKSIKEIIRDLNIKKEQTAVTPFDMRVN